MSLKKQLSSLVHEVAYRTGVAPALGRTRPWLRVIMIHGVGSADCPAGAFGRMLRDLARHYRIVPLAQLARQLDYAPQEWSRQAGLVRQVALTFDDGLRNHYAVAYPVLKSLGLPATFFVCPGLVGTGRWLWNHECRARLAWLGGEARQAFAAGAGAPGVGTPSITAVESVVGWMKTLPLARRLAVEARLREVTGPFQPTPKQQLDYDLMGWEELGALDPALITIGAHTVSHPILTTLEPAAQAREIRDSRTLLEAKLGRPVTQFCYPNGSLDPAVVRCVEDNFELAVTTAEGAVEAGCSRCLIPRIPVADTPRLMAWRMFRPGA